MEKRKVFITGIAGFLGSNLAKYLLDQGHEVTGCDNLVGGLASNVPLEAKFYFCDCSDLINMKILLKDQELVYHCACLPHEGLSVFSPHLIVSSVINTSTSVFSAGISNGVKKIVNCSSMARYGNLDIPYHEEQIASPVDPYGIAKLASEKILDSLSRVHGIDYVTVVPHNIVGPGQKYDDPFRNVVAITINRLLQNLSPIVYGDGKQLRCFSDVREVVESLSWIGLGSLNREVINVGPDQDFITINELVNLIQSLLGTSKEVIYLPDRPSEVKKAVCSSKKLDSIFISSRKYSLIETVQSLIDWIKSRGIREFRKHLEVEIKSDLTPRTWL